MTGAPPRCSSPTRSSRRPPGHPHARLARRAAERAARPAVSRAPGAGKASPAPGHRGRARAARTASGVCGVCGGDHSRRGRALVGRGIAHPVAGAAGAARGQPHRPGTVPGVDARSRRGSAQRRDGATAVCAASPRRVPRRDVGVRVGRRPLARRGQGDPAAPGRSRHAAHPRERPLGDRAPRSAARLPAAGGARLRRPASTPRRHLGARRADGDRRHGHRLPRPGRRREAVDDDGGGERARARMAPPRACAGSARAGGRGRCRAARPHCSAR